ncbi:MAG: hypothetical protein IT379_19350 [Deltaproteobacteria bacterium]|nr:hypothetical protein [Deltaproteobacteria bacterium]
MSLFDDALARFDKRAFRRWLPAYVGEPLPPRPDPSRPVHLWVAVADHFEPRWGTADPEVGRHRMKAWAAKYPLLASRHTDSSGRPVQHTFYYAIEEYDPHDADLLAGMQRDGFGEVEVHHHHHADTAASFGEMLEAALEVLSTRHGLMRRDAGGRLRFSFVHGNWALANSHPQGRYCGVTGEIDVLLRAGCDSDMTMPSAPDATQARRINRIYYAHDRADGRAIDDGVDAVRGQPANAGLLMVPGPLGFNLQARKMGVVPRIENGALDGDVSRIEPAKRVAAWLRLAPRLPGEPNHLFVKLHAHGTLPGSDSLFLDAEDYLDRMCTYLEGHFDDGVAYVLHYATAADLVTAIHAIEDGHDPVERVAERRRTQRYG